MASAILMPQPGTRVLTHDCMILSRLTRTMHAQTWLKETWDENDDMIYISCSSVTQHVSVASEINAFANHACNAGQFSALLCHTVVRCW